MFFENIYADKTYFLPIHSKIILYLYGDTPHKCELLGVNTKITTNKKSIEKFYNRKSFLEDYEIKCFQLVYEL